jgi:outer membrane protein TolC
MKCRRAGIVLVFLSAMPAPAAAQEIPPLPPGRPASYAPPIGARRPKPEAPERLPQGLPPSQAAVPQTLPIDLPTALRLADAQNPQIQFARERILAAEADLERTSVLLLPNLLAGGEWTRHDGQIQEVRGNVIPVNKSAVLAAGGFRTNVSLADAYFEPLAARQVVANRVANARTTANDTLRDVALQYYETVRAKANSAIAQETVGNAEKLNNLAQSYFRNQKLKEADAKRAEAEYRTRLQEAEAIREAAAIASIRLAQQLRLDPFVMLDPAEAQAAPITVVDPDAAANELAITALMNRPELAESQALVNVAIERLRRATYGPLFPSVLLDYRAGFFAGGPKSFVGNAGARSDADALVFWELHNLGFGDHALKRERESEVRQAQIRVVAAMDQIVAEVADALARLKSLRAQMVVARQTVASAERSYQLNWKLFTDGGIDLIRPIEVVQSVQALAVARVSYLNAVIEHNRAQFQLYWALGLPVEDAKPEH